MPHNDTIVRYQKTNSSGEVNTWGGTVNTYKPEYPQLCRSHVREASQIHVKEDSQEETSQGTWPDSET